jgi:cell division protein FtsB
MSHAFRIATGSLLLLLLALQSQLWLSPQGMREVFRLRGEIETQQQRNAELARRNALLTAEVTDLRDGLAALEERARTDLGMIRDSETFYRSVPPQRELRRAVDR